MRKPDILRAVLLGTFFAAALLSAGNAGAQSPSSIGGRTIALTISSGSFPFASRGSYRFLPSATDARYAVVPVSGNIEASTGTHTYTKTGANTARLSLVDEEIGGLTANCTFTTPDSGTYTLTSALLPGTSQSGSFTVHAGPAPSTITGNTVTVTITSGEWPFAAFGSYRFTPALSGNTYAVRALSGEVNDSSGTYSYTRNSEHTGVVSFTDSVAGPGFSAQLSFDSASTGTVFVRQSGGPGYQTGLFSFSAVATPPSISSQPINQSAVAGASVAFTVSASGTSPLSFQWRKEGNNLPGTTGSTYTIGSVREADAGGYDVVVSNSAGSVISSRATLAVIIPPLVTSQPASDSVLTGERAVFTVTATGSSPLTYQWIKDGLELPGPTLPSYTVENVQTADAGVYSVRISNAAGAVNSAPATLRVIRVAVRFPILSFPDWNPATGFHFTLQGESRTAYRIQWSPDLLEWFDLTDLVTGSVRTEIRDGDALPGTRRFYRAVSP